jgi:hypothetical protein
MFWTGVWTPLSFCRRESVQPACLPLDSILDLLRSFQGVHVFITTQTTRLASICILTL